MAGGEIEKNVKKRYAYRVTVRMDDGSFRTISLSSPPTLAVGDRSAWSKQASCDMKSGHIENPTLFNEEGKEDAGLTGPVACAVVAPVHLGSTDSGCAAELVHEPIAVEPPGSRALRGASF